MPELNEEQKAQLKKHGYYTRVKDPSTVRRTQAEKYDDDSGYAEQKELKMPRRAYWDREQQIERNIGGTE